MTKTRHLARRSAGCLLAAAACAAVAQEPSFPDREAAIASLYPGETLMQAEAGDLDGDGRPDVVVTLSPARPASGEDDLGPLLRVVVFRATADGRLQRWVATGAVNECHHNTLLTVERGSLFLGCAHHLGIHGGENFSQRLQFANRRGTLRLIGDNTESIQDMNGPHEKFATTSRNLLTGQVVERPYSGREKRSVDRTSTPTPLAEWEGW